jgi:para-aminobenzoate synthetase/4-amino-4-deoxychorismate lyase
VIEAHALADVVPALRAAESAARAGRWVVGYVAYEAAPGFDPALRVLPGSGPLAWFGVHDAPLPAPPPGSTDGRLADAVPEMDAGAHAAAVEVIREAVAAGAVYQVNLTFRLRGRMDGDPLALHRRLRDAQGSGDAAYVRTGSRAVISASPELFLLRRGDSVITRPMKGTARRGRFPQEDAAVRLGLLSSEKDRAENVMIADLLRNDLGRVAATGSVHAGPLLQVERLRTVWQLTSTVSARLRPDVDLSDLFRATFPCGSVTGAPKVAAMRLAATLERSPRGAYCGAVGAIAPGGDACFNVGIRTAEVDLATGAALYGTGGGITWDSNPAAEWDEALAKTRILESEPGLPTLLETMRLEGGRVGLLDGHLARLSGSAHHLGVRLDLAAVRARIESEAGDARLRLLVSPAGDATVERAPLPEPAPGPVPVAFSVDPVDRRDPALFHKTTRRAPYERRRAERPDAFDVLLLNREGEVTEGTFTNLVAEIDGERLTPPLDAGLLPGVFREGLLARGEVREGLLHPGDLARARRLWVVNALRGWIEARLIP